MTGAEQTGDERLASKSPARRGCTGCGTRVSKLLVGAVGQAQSKLGIALSLPQVQSERAADCRACDSSTKGPDGRAIRCLECDCYLYDKIRLRRSRCPRKKWKR